MWKFVNSFICSPDPWGSFYFKKTSLNPPLAQEGRLLETVPEGVPCLSEWQIPGQWDTWISTLPQENKKVGEMTEYSRAFFMGLSQNLLLKRSSFLLRVYGGFCCCSFSLCMGLRFSVSVKKIIDLQRLWNPPNLKVPHTRRGGVS